MAHVDPMRLKEQITALLAATAGPEAGASADLIIAAARRTRPDDWSELAMEWAGKHGTGASLSLFTGRARFLDIELLADGNVLTPRAETEILGNEVLAILGDLARADPARELRMIDMGCGSGNLACAAALACPQARIWASDLTEACAGLTLRNVALHGLEDRVQVTVGDLFAPLAGRSLEATIDLVEMNPPYIPTASLGKSHARLLLHEPREAFDGGPYGISIVSRLLQEAPPFLKAGGFLVFEFGLGQDRIVQALVDRNPAYALVRHATDTDHKARVAVLRKL